MKINRRAHKPHKFSMSPCEKNANGMCLTKSHYTKKHEFDIPPLLVEIMLKRMEANEFTLADISKTADASGLAVSISGDIIACELLRKLRRKGLVAEKQMDRNASATYVWVGHDTPIF